MQKALCSIGHGLYEPLLEISSQTFAAYAARHGYDLVLRKDVPDDGRPIPWAKVPLVLELLETYDLVVWIDADAIIVDDRYDLADEIRADRWMYLSRMTTPEGLVPNTGVWMFTQRAESKAFLGAVYAHVAFLYHKWWENAAAIDLLGYQFDPVKPGAENEFTTGVYYLDRAWNSIRPDPAPKPRIKHYCGLPLEARCEALAADLAAIERETIKTDRISVGSVHSVPTQS
jgi:hypothetical protein